MNTPPFKRNPLMPFDPAAGLSEVSREPRTYVEQVITAMPMPDVALIHRVVNRFMALFDEYGVQLTKDTGAVVMSSLQLGMDVALVHYRTPLNLDAMMLGSDRDLIDDLIGIQQHVDRTNGELRDGWRPRNLRVPS